MSKHISNLSELSRNTFTAFEIASRSSTGFAQRPIAQALQGWSEMTIAACQQARMTLELPSKIAACQSPDDLAKVQSTYLNGTINSYLHATATLASLLSSPIAVTDVESTRDALWLEPSSGNPPYRIEADKAARPGANVQALKTADDGERDEQSAPTHALRKRHAAA